jgi:hypothetical protein
VAAFVEADRREPVGRPGVGGVEFERAGVERLVSVFVREDEALAAAALLEAVGLEVGAEAGGERDAASAGAALGLDEAGAAVPAALDVDEVVVEVDLVPVQGLEFAEAEAGVEGGGLDRPVGEGEGCEQGGGSSGRATRSRWPRTAGRLSLSVGLRATSPRL